MKLLKKRIIAVLIFCLAGSALHMTYSGRIANRTSAEAELEKEKGYKETTVTRGTLLTGVNESGSVSIGLEEQLCTLGKDSSEPLLLKVETVYVTVGQRVKESDPLLKLTDESTTEYRTMLESAAAAARIAVKEARLERNENKLKLEYEYKTNLARGEVAQAEYDSTIAGLENQITEIQTAIEKAKKEIDDLTKRLAAGEKVQEELEAKQENYAELSAKLITAQNNLITGRITAKQNYDLAMLNFENADSIYELGKKELDSKLDDEREKLEAAEKELEAFEALIGDGTIYSDYTGIVTSVGFKEGDNLTDGEKIAEFQNAEKVIMEVEVNQEDVSTISVGDRTAIKLTAYGDQIFEGEVQSVDMSSSSGSSAVNYTVTVRFMGDVSLVYADMTGNVTFVDGEAANVLYVSNKAVFREGTGSYVNVLKKDGSIQKTKVETGFSDGYHVEIISGLEEGETVIIESRVSK